MERSHERNSKRSNAFGTLAAGVNRLYKNSELARCSAQHQLVSRKIALWLYWWVITYPGIAKRVEMYHFPLRNFDPRVPYIWGLGFWRTLGPREAEVATAPRNGLHPWAKKPWDRRSGRCS